MVAVGSSNDLLRFNDRCLGRDDDGSWVGAGQGLLRAAIEVMRKKRENGISRVNVGGDVG